MTTPDGRTKIISKMAATSARSSHYRPPQPDLQNGDDLGEVVAILLGDEANQQAASPHQDGDDLGEVVAIFVGVELSDPPPWSRHPARPQTPYNVVWPPLRTPKPYRQFVGVIRVCSGEGCRCNCLIIVNFRTM